MTAQPRTILVMIFAALMFAIMTFALSRAIDYEHYYNTCVIQGSSEPICTKEK